eukprot:CAMPEP_0201672672 /NCGR_PEP_ID=MMETSP0494-20130426/32815_1 /ASSEMBLY_ACC=CAM_ASM_000839 /TAXON_ID=420259 /ORGANISM="Thalassiosira gravida, Strain GMp14c1" /LENGTH=74 /DNA_ID=CAMNT_0048154363 /DNA_START=62 /DNA_END=283 /DNA_ORIENTATION=+
MNPVTRSHAVSAQHREGSSSPPQNVEMNHFRSHRGGKPLRTLSSVEQARCQSWSMEARWELRRRHPMEEPVRAR